ncbi:MAG: hypothetical protein U0L92_07815 [Clostridia bacterium]|nr:hypothetical protein [Clostridia bacterium]
MKDWKNLWKQLIFPPRWLMLVWGILRAAMLTVVFLKGWDTTSRFNQIMVGITGAGVCAIEVVISVYTIAHANKGIAKLQTEKEL